MRHHGTLGGMLEMTFVSRLGHNALVSNVNVATQFRRHSISHLMAWPNLFWCLALVGLLLLPSDYRAGAETAHPHAFAQLWLDASDGTINHIHEHQRSAGSGRALASSWHDPLIVEADSASAESTAMSGESADLAEQQESAPVASGVHLLLPTVFIALVLGVGQAIGAGSTRLIAGVCPRIMFPPPRWTPLAA